MSERIEDSLNALNSMPELEPPERVRQSTLQAMAAVAEASRPRRRTPVFLRAAAWLLAVGVGAFLIVWTGSGDDRGAERELTAQPSAEQPPTGEPSATSGQPPTSEPPATADVALLELAERSMQLEELLASMPPSRRVMRADTASTIVGLEDRIAWIDAELIRAESVPAAPPYREALMRDRVDVMSALVNVRYAQSRVFIH